MSDTIHYTNEDSCCSSSVSVANTEDISPIASTFNPVDFVVRNDADGVDAAKPVPKTGMSGGKNKKNNIASGGLLITACVACCAPLLAPPVLAFIAAGGVGFALVGQVGFALLLLAGGGIYVWSRRRNQVTHQNQAANGCSCSPDAGCNTGDTCDIPVIKARPSLLARIKSLC